MSQDVNQQASGPTTLPDLAVFYGKPAGQFDSIRLQIKNATLKPFTATMRQVHGQEKDFPTLPYSTWYAWKVERTAWIELFQGDESTFPEKEPRRPQGYNKLVAAFETALSKRGAPSGAGPVQSPANNPPTQSQPSMLPRLQINLQSDPKPLEAFHKLTMEEKDAIVSAVGKAYEGEIKLKQDTINTLTEVNLQLRATAAVTSATIARLDNEAQRQAAEIQRLTEEVNELRKQA